MKIDETVEKYLSEQDDNMKMAVMDKGLTGPKHKRLFQKTSKEVVDDEDSEEESSKNKK